MPSLADLMRVVLANALVFRQHAHIAHWNIQGAGLFPSLHDFLGELYEDLETAVDDAAERIRVLGEQAPSTIAALLAPATIPDDAAAPQWSAVRSQLLRDNAYLVACLREAADAASDADDQGLLNWIADRLDRQGKWGWKLQSS